VISVENRKTSHTLVFCAPAGFPLELGIGAGSQQTRMMWLSGGEKSLTIHSAIWIECTNLSERQTDTGPQQRPRLRKAFRGKKQTTTCSQRLSNTR